MTRILLTNDDGIHSDGLIKLEEALKPIGDVYVVAPRVGNEWRFAQSDARSSAAYPAA
jgi:5'/3'-nucleotidase SurE